jgi:mannose-6-phosphate isomerase-like protein (cupin superfamily)
MTKLHHQRLPAYSALLSGREPPDEIGFKSDKLQIWYNNTDTPWKDNGLHKHLESDEGFIVLKGALIVELENNQCVLLLESFVIFP